MVKYEYDFRLSFLPVATARGSETVVRAILLLFVQLPLIPRLYREVRKITDSHKRETLGWRWSWLALSNPISAKSTFRA